MTDSNQLVTRLKQFDKGCQSLINAQLLQLSDSNRQLVKDACRTCRSEIAIHLSSIADQAEFDIILSAANTSITDLENAIRELM